MAKDHCVDDKALRNRFEQQQKPSTTTKPNSRGRKAWLPSIAEAKLAVFVKFMDTCNLSLDYGQVKDRALIMAKDLGLTKFKATTRWVKGFINRHDLVSRMSQAWDAKRQAHSNPKIIQQFFDILKNAIDMIEKKTGKKNC